MPAEVMTRLDYELGRHRRHGLLRLLPGGVGPDPLRPLPADPGRARAAARRPAAAWPTASRSSTSTPSATTSSSSGSSIRAAIQMPDIDMDFDERYRGDMIKYAAERYGSDHVAQIVTFSTIKARAAVRDAARVLGLPLHRGRQDRQGHAPAAHGPGHPAGRLSDPDRRARGRVRGGRRAAGHVRDRRPRPNRSSTWPRGSRGCGARTGSTPPRWSSPTNR